MKPATLTAAALAAATLPLAATAADKTPASVKQPNIIIILSDDMGYTDIGCYGGEIRTPAIDKLAQRGLRFTQFYNNARCCPTRASLLTGLYAHQAGMGGMNRNQKHPGYTGSLRDNCVTIAEMLRPGGYSTYAVGKWHVSLESGEPANWPLRRGFDKFYGTILGYGSFYDPATLCRDNTLITPLNDPGYKPPSGKYYYTDAIADNAVLYIKQHQRDNAAADGSASKPFFMYVAFTAAHWPMHALPEDIAKYKGVYDNGYDPVRVARHKRAIELGVLPPGTKLTPSDNAGWDNVKDKAWEARCMEVYAAMIDRMDQGIARIVAQLDASGQLDNTIIMFMHDNGGCAEPQGRQPEPAANVPAPGETFRPLGPDEPQPKARPPHMQARDGRPIRTGVGTMPGPEDTYIGYGHDWANVSNTPFREYKHWVHEGGISTPLIVHWPAGIPAALNGTFVRPPAHIIDLAATCVDLAGAKYPAKRGDTALTPLAGVSLRPLFTGAQTLQRPAPIFWEHEGNRAVRDGDWKLVAKGSDGPWELYNIAADRAELNNLAAQHKDIANRLAAAWENWAIEAKAKPWPWDKIKPGNANAKKTKTKNKRNKGAKS
ncbi:arylsulfatase A-like enzyme [Ereboglobus sp. PH5-10]|uniref:arylsulfatase n=1 Tax=Ereboglobus sp. PH5-10 TaxID=2940629 RepID=UPI002406F467|nr:arylsulfatase [Ereboglobus sp. PH5-10]MDF9826136.1 arylsulfatase A-like enzyme [Ereboglobus sp. PH5-10]